MHALFIRILLAVVAISSLTGRPAAQTPAPEGCPESQFSDWGGAGVVTPGDANNLREKPSASAARIGKIEPGEVFIVMYQSATCADGYLWVEVQTLTMRGWTVENSADGGDPFVVRYVPETREIGEHAENGSIRVEDSGVAFTVPAGLDIARVTVTPDVGFFGDSMSAQPSSLVFEFFNGDDKPRGDIEIYPYTAAGAAYKQYAYDELEALLTDQPPLLEYTAGHRMPYGPQGGAAALFGGAGAYLTFGSGSGLRFITYFAQDYVLFRPDTTYEYLYRGLTTDQVFFVSAQNFPVKVPAGTVPAGGSRADNAYSGYLRAFEANLAAQPASAFTPDLGLLDALFASLTITNSEALLDAIP